MGWVSMDINNEATDKNLPSSVVWDASQNYATANGTESNSSDSRTIMTENSLTWQSRFKNPDAHNLQAQVKMQTSTSFRTLQYLKSYGIPSSSMTDATSPGTINQTQTPIPKIRVSVGWDVCTMCSWDVISLMPTIV